MATGAAAADRGALVVRRPGASSVRRAVIGGTGVAARGGGAGPRSLPNVRSTSGRSSPCGIGPTTTITMFAGT